MSGALAWQVKKPNKDFHFVLRGDGMDTLPFVLSLMSAVPTLLFCFVFLSLLFFIIRSITNACHSVSAIAIRRKLLEISHVI